VVDEMDDSGEFSSVRRGWLDRSLGSRSDSSLYHPRNEERLSLKIDVDKGVGGKADTIKNIV
jgi:hypothetical protein